MSQTYEIITRDFPYRGLAAKNVPNTLRSNKPQHGFHRVYKKDICY